MKFPSWLYQLTQRDLQVTPLEIIHVSATFFEVSAGPIVDLYKVPDGKILLIDNCCVLLTPNALYYPLAVELQKFDPGQNQLLGAMHFPVPTGTTGAARSGEIGKGVTVEQGSNLRVLSHFSGGAANNTITAYLNGILIPRGNFAI